MAQQTVPAPKKSVALSGVTAGNTALCTVGRGGDDLHYRGYDILDIAEHCCFEEIAHLLVHGDLPTQVELAAYRDKLKSLRGLPAAVKRSLQELLQQAQAVPTRRYPLRENRQELTGHPDTRRYRAVAQITVHRT